MLTQLQTRDGPEVLAVITARGSSKSIPRKNLVLLAGRPMITYTFDAAAASRHISRTILSTDDPEIADLGRQFGVEVPFLRPAELAEDDTPTLPVIQHGVRFLSAQEDYQPEYILILQPTSPLRCAEHIDSALEILTSSGADSVVSVTEVPHHFNPVSLMRLDGSRLVPFTEGPLILRRQDKPAVYARNGPAVLAMRRDILLDSDSLYGDNCVPYVMDIQESLDVDTPYDLKIAEISLLEQVNSRV